MSISGYLRYNVTFMQFKLKAPFAPTGDQPTAIKSLVEGVESSQPHQVLLGVTGSGKTYTMANVIQETQLPTLVIAHNKTLAAQLYQEFRDFFPENAVSYFVSYYDYYQPEAYIPSTDTYIEKEATINDEIDKLRLSSTTNLLTRRDVIVVASVSCIYNLGSPVEYGKNVMELIEGEVIQRETLLLQLANLQYQRSDIELRRGTYRIRGDILQLWPAYEDLALKIETLENKISSINWIDPLTGSPKLPEKEQRKEFAQMGQEPAIRQKRFTIYPAKHYVVNDSSQAQGLEQIEADLAVRVQQLKEEGKIVEAYRLQQKVTHDVMMIRELGFVNGIENYSRYFDGRMPGEAPFTLIDYFHENARMFSNGKYLTLIDESHMTLPQIRGMYAGDQARKTTLIEYGFRLPSALDNRPLKSNEFMNRMEQVIHVSATPNEYEISLAGGETVEQLIRPTGLVDPLVTLRPTKYQIEDLVMEVIYRKSLGQRTLVTTLTKRMAEALTEYLNNQEKIIDLIERRKQHLEQQEEVDPDEKILLDQDGYLPIESMEVGSIPNNFLHATQHQTPVPSLDLLQFPKVAYLHSDVITLERSDILDDLRRGVYDVVVGINLLREGLDLPEVSLVAILDADKEGFLRSRSALIQTMGRAARHEEGRVILYADKLTGSMKAAISETQRRRQIQVAYNAKHGITPKGISKPVRERMIEKSEEDTSLITKNKKDNKTAAREGELIIHLNKDESIDLMKIVVEDLTPHDKKRLAAKLRRRMSQAAKDLDYELATILRDHVYRLEK